MDRFQLPKYCRVDILLNTKAPGIASTHLIDPRTMRAWVDLEAAQ